MNTSFGMKKRVDAQSGHGDTDRRVVTGMREIVEPQSLASASLQDLNREVLIRLGEDPDRQGLRDTPGRLERSLTYLTKRLTPEASAKPQIIPDLVAWMICRLPCPFLRAQRSKTS